jgi:hypothetical protein
MNIIMNLESSLRSQTILVLLLAALAMFEIAPALRQHLSRLRPEEVATPSKKRNGLSIAKMSRAVEIHNCTKQNQLRLEDPAFGNIRLVASMPSTSTFQAGTYMRIPIFNELASYNSSDSYTKTSWQYNLWARLVGPVGIIPVTRIDYYYNTEPQNTNLFAELEFVVWQPGTYSLEVELRYLYGNQVGARYTLSDTSVFSNELISKVTQQEGIFPLGSNTVDFFKKTFVNEVPVIYMGRDNDFETWRNTYRQKNTSSWGPFHFNWINNHCFGIVGSPYMMDIEGESQEILQIKAISGVQNKPKTRTCTASDTMKPGFWRLLQINCTSLDRHPGCNFIWDSFYKGPGYVYETPGCEWEFPNTTRLSTCFAEFGNRLNIVGDSLVRMIHDALIVYFKLKQFHNITFGTDYKKRGSSLSGKDGHSFSTREGAFIDDFSVLHKVGWGSNRDLDRIESSPGRLARDLSIHRKWFDEARSRDGRSTSARFIYYVPNYVNEFRTRQSFEPFMSFYAALTGEFFQSELGYEIFNANKLTRALPEGTGDGLHYRADVTRFMAIMLLNALCPP